MLSLYSNGRTTGLVLDSGDGVFEFLGGVEDAEVECFFLGRLVPTLLLRLGDLRAENNTPSLLLRVLRPALRVGIRR